MGYEDFTTFNTVDPNNHIQIPSGTHIDHAGYRNEDCYAYKDYGSGHFGDFEHLVDAKSDFLQNSGLSFVWMLSNELDDFQGLWDGNKTAIAVAFWKDSLGNRKVGIWEIYNGTRYLSISGANEFAANTWYYAVITKSGTSLTCKFYTDPERTSLFRTYSLTLQGDYKLRYLYACNVLNDGFSSNYANFDIENLDRQEVLAQSNYETLAFQDGFSRIVDATRTFPETLSFLDSVFVPKFAELLESLVLQDSFFRVASYIRLFEEPISFLDLVQAFRRFFYLTLEEEEIKTVYDGPG